MMEEKRDIFPRVVIKETPKGTQISINGKIVDGVCGYSVEHEAGKIPVLRLCLSAINMELDEKMIPELPDVFKEFYKPNYTDNPESAQ